MAVIVPAGGWTTFAETDLQGLPLPPQTQSAQEVYGQLATGVQYDFCISYVSVDNVIGPQTIFKTNFSSGILPSSVQGTNQVVDSNFATASFGRNNAGPTGIPTKAGADPNWKFLNIDGITWYIGKGGDAQGDNYMAVGHGGSGSLFTGISEPITVVPGQQWMCSAYIDARTSSGGSTGGAFVGFCDYTGSNTYTTLYAHQAQTAGQNGTVSLSSALTIPPGVTQICVILSSDSMTVSSSMLVMNLPCAIQSTIATGYSQGPVTDGTGNTKSTQSSATFLTVNTGLDSTTLATSPQVTAGVVPTSGGGAPLTDQLPQGSVRIVQPGSGQPGALYQQTSFVSTSPAWVFIGPYTAGTAINLASGVINVVPEDVNIIIASQVFGRRF